MEKTFTFFLPEYSPLLFEFPEAGEAAIQQTIKIVMVFFISFKYIIFNRSDAVRFIATAGMFDHLVHKNQIGFCLEFR